MPANQNLLLDGIFFGVSSVVLSLVAIWPGKFFRAITLGRFDEREVSPHKLNAVRVIAAVATASILIRIATELFRHTA